MENIFSKTIDSNTVHFTRKDEQLYNIDVAENPDTDGFEVFKDSKDGHWKIKPDSRLPAWLNGVGLKIHDILEENERQ